MSLIDKLKKNSTIKETDLIMDSKVFKKKNPIETAVPMVNVALSGDVEGGLLPGTLVLAGPSKHFKSAFALLVANAFLKKYPEDGAVLFYDSEFGTPEQYFDNLNIDKTRVVHSPITDIEELKFDIVQQLNGLDKDDHICIIVDSIGNLASKKEVEDALDRKSVADMTRAKAFKSLFRMVTPHLSMKEIPFIVVNHTYSELSMHPRQVVSGGCLIKGTKIWTIAGLKEIQDVDRGDIILTLLGEKVVTNSWNPETLENGEPECYEIEFEDGYKCVVSENHKFLTENGWLEAKTLTKNSTIIYTNIEERDTGIFYEKHSLFNIVNIKSVGKKKVYDISVADAEHYILENGVVTHNTGVMYSSDNVWVIGRQQEKDGSEVTGYHFIINIEKSRFVKEKSKIPITVMFDGGIMKWSGLFDEALKGGFILNPSKGYYSLKEDPESKFRKSVIEHDDAFWKKMLADETFTSYIKAKYAFDGNMMIGDSD
jgi:hypothetical protein